MYVHIPFHTLNISTYICMYLLMGSYVRSYKYTENKPYRKKSYTDCLIIR